MVIRLVEIQEKLVLDFFQMQEELEEEDGLLLFLIMRL